MNIIIKQTKEQQVKAFKTYLKFNNQGVVIFWFILLFFILFSGALTLDEIKNAETEFDFINSTALASIPCLLIFIFLNIRLIRNYYRVKKYFQTFDFEVLLNSEFIEIDFNETKYEWKNINNYFFYENILVINLNKNKENAPLILNLESETTNNIVYLKNIINTKPLGIVQKNTNKLNTFDYIYFTLSLVPFIGVIFAIISLIIGIQKKSWLLKLVWIISVITTTFSGYTFINYISNITNDTDNWLIFNENDLNKTLVYLENYKLENGIYPDSLGSLKKYDAFMFFNEIPNNEPFYYEKITDSTFYLFAKGKDQTPFTTDDIYPPNAMDSIKKTKGIILKTE